MKKLSLSKKKIALSIILLLGIYLLIVLWPIRSLVLPMLKGKTLVVFTNEAEARPCGGFASAYGIISALPPKFELKNVYALADSSYWEAEYPLTLVNDKENFWDAGTSSDLAECTDSFKNHYESARSEEISHVLLIDFKTLQEVVGLWSQLSLGDEKINAQNFFATMSRKVADVDRHDEESLAIRKSPLADLGKKIIFKSLNPTIPPQLTRILAKNMQNGHVYSSKSSSDYSRRPQDFALTEWNLGGGKSSRYLQKNIKISGRELSPKKWQWKVRLEIDHTGGWDEPLSQDWKGLFVIDFPEFLNQAKIEREVSIAPGESYNQGFIFDKEGTPPSDIGLFIPRGQELNYDVSFAALPQQNVISDSLEIRENTAFGSGAAEHPRTSLNLEILPDKQDPFITFHKIISPEVLSESERSLFGDSNTLVEIHFSENVFLSNDFTAELIDRDYENKTLSENPIYKNHILKDDKHSLLIGFANDVQQLEERYYIKLFGVNDLVGNTLDPEAPRTVIDRVIRD